LFEAVFSVCPMPKARPRFTRQGFAYTTKENRDFEAKLKLLMRAEFRGKPLEVPLRLELTFSVPKPKSCKRQHPTVKPDVDNFCKMVMDCGNGILWTDDNLVVELVARKEYGKPGIRLVVTEM
jgi:Holliday junction resolvase RusA-like endonuclease